MRIVSLLPSTTEILFAIGAGDHVVGVTFECDSPPEARSRRVVSSTALPQGLSPREIDDFVAAAVASGEDLYRLDSGALRDLDPDLVVTQDLCRVCALDVSTVDEALGWLGCSAEVLTIDPHTLEEVLGSIVLLGRHTGRLGAAEQLVECLHRRLEAVVHRVGDRERPRVMVLEWTDPPYAPGHWLPEMVSLAGGEPVLGTVGGRSTRTTWEQVCSATPDVVVCAPCGYDLEGSATLGEQVLGHLPAVPTYAVDAGAAFVRPGPRLVDGVEVLADLLHPVGHGSVEVDRAAGAGWLRLR